MQVIKGKYGVEVSCSFGFRTPPSLPSNYSSIGIFGGIGNDKLNIAAFNLVRKFYPNKDNHKLSILTGIGFNLMKFNSKIDFLPHYTILSNDYFYRTEIAKVFGFGAFSQLQYSATNRIEINLRINAALNPYKNLYGGGIGFGFMLTNNKD